jgi:hypothetical protein
MASPKCPPATQDVALNLANRQKAIRVASYGPANPREPSLGYWSKLAKAWDVSIAEAKTMRCGNCAAFGVTTRELKCVEDGIGREGIDPADRVVAAELGYCRMFKFKCAASRTCSAWIVGGPITDAKERRR